MSFDFLSYSRIIVVGSAGSGKSWISKHISQETGYKLIHLDNEYWQPGWVKTPRPEWILKQEKLISGEKWIVDGNYESTMELRFKAADLIVFLDINRFTCIWSAVKRTGKKRSDLPDYLEEPCVFNKEFFDFCKWIWSYPKKGRNIVLDLHEKYAEKEFLHIKKRKDIKKLLLYNKVKF